MADVKITGLAAAPALASGDLVEVVDVSDTSGGASGTSGKATIAQIGVAVTPDYILASSDAPASWLLKATATVTAGVDIKTAIETAFASGKKTIGLAGTHSLLSAASCTPPDDCTFVMLDGAYIQCGPQVGEDPNAPPTLLTIGGTRTTVLNAVTNGPTITAGDTSATFSGIGSIVAGDYVMLQTNTLFGPNRTGEYTGEIIRVLSVSSLTLKFARPVRYTYPTGTAFTLARYVMPKNFRTNLDIRGDATSMVRQMPALLQYMRNVTCDHTFASGVTALSGIRCEEILNLHFDEARAEDVNDSHGASAAFAGAATTTTQARSPGDTSVTVTSSSGFATPASGFAWLGNPGATDTNLLIAFTAIIGGEPVRVTRINSLTWTLAAPGFVNSHNSGVAVSINGSYTGYGYHIVGCENVTGSINGRSCRHLWDVKSVNTRPCSFNVKLTGSATDCAGSAFSSHGSADQVGWTDTKSEGCGGHEVFRSLNPHSIRPTCIHPTYWTRGIYDRSQMYSVMSLFGEDGTVDGGTSGDSMVWEDGYLDAAGCPTTFHGVLVRDRSHGAKITTRRYFAPTGNGVWFAGPENFGSNVDIGFSGANQVAVAGTPEGRAAAVQFAVETGDTAGQSNRGARVRVIDGDALGSASILGARGPSVYVEGFATDVAASNTELDIDVEKRALGTSQTSSTAQIVLGAGYHNRANIKGRFPGTLAASAVSTTGTLKRPLEWEKYSRFSDLASPAALDGDTLGLYPPAAYGFLAWTFDHTTNSGTATVLTTGRLETAELWCPPGTITGITYNILTTAGSGLTSGQSFMGLWAPGAGGAQLALTASLHTAFASTGIATANLTSSLTWPGGFIRVGVYSVGSTPPSFDRAASSTVPNAILAVPRFGHSNATTYTTTPPSAVPTLTASNNSWWFALTGTRP